MLPGHANVYWVCVVPANHKNKLWDKSNLSAERCYAIVGAMWQLCTHVHVRVWRGSRGAFLPMPCELCKWDRLEQKWQTGLYRNNLTYDTGETRGGWSKGLLLKQKEMQTPKSRGNHKHLEARGKTLLCNMMICRDKKDIFLKKQSHSNIYHIYI